MKYQKLILTFKEHITVDISPSSNFNQSKCDMRFEIWILYALKRIPLHAFLKYLLVFEKQLFLVCKMSRYI